MERFTAAKWSLQTKSHHNLLVMGHATRIFRKRQIALQGPKISKNAAALMEQNGITLEDFPAGATNISIREVRQVIFRKQNPINDGSQKQGQGSEEE